MTLCFLLLSAMVAAWFIDGLLKTQSEKQIAVDKEMPPKMEAFPAHYPVNDKPVPVFTLVDQNGNNISPTQFIGRSVLLTFVYAHCATMCPVVVHNVLEAIDKGHKDTVLLAITLDPWRDTPSKIEATARNWGFKKEMYFLSGTVEAVNDVIDAFAFPRERDASTGEVNHPGLVYLINKNGKIHYTLNNPSISWLREALVRMDSQTQS